MNLFRLFVAAVFCVFAFAHAACGKTFETLVKQLCPHDYRNSSECTKAIERSQIKKYSDAVQRNDNKLRLRLKGGQFVELKDLTREECERTADGGEYKPCVYTFWGYNKSINYYLVFEGYWEGIGFSLVNRDTGKIFSVSEFPNIAPDNQRFVTVDIKDAYSSEKIQIWRFKDKKLICEWTFEPDSYWMDTDAEWIDVRTLKITYYSSDRKTKRIKNTFWVRLGNKGWQKSEK